MKTYLVYGHYMVYGHYRMAFLAKNSSSLWTYNSYNCFLVIAKEGLTANTKVFERCYSKSSKGVVYGHYRFFRTHSATIWKFHIFFAFDYTEPFFYMEDNIYLELNMGYKKCNSLSYSSPVGLLNISTFEIFDMCYNDGHLSK